MVALGGTRYQAIRRLPLLIHAANAGVTHVALLVDVPIGTSGSLVRCQTARPSRCEHDQQQLRPHLLAPGIAAGLRLRGRQGLVGGLTGERW